MGLFGSMNIAGSALTAQRLRMDVISGNIANAETTRTNGQRDPYRRQQVVFEPILARAQFGGDANTPPTGGLQVASITRDQAPPREVYDPTHPDADPATGMVAYPNVDVGTEMTDMLSASRAYEANVTVLNAIKSMAMKSLDLGRP